MVIVSIVVGIAIGIIASLIAVRLDHLYHERQLKATFGYLEGEWDHLDIEHKNYEGATTKIIYKGSSTFRLEASTSYGPWKGRIVMTPQIPEYGRGMFQYDGKDESGLLQIIGHFSFPVPAMPPFSTRRLLQME